MKSNIWSFYKALLKNPREIGAAAPSSRFLANAIVKHITLENNSALVELGPGTGIITSKIIESDINRDNIYLVEKSKSLATKLCGKFPKIHVLHGDAMHLCELYKSNSKPVTTIISSLPLLAIPEQDTRHILQQIEQLLEPNGYFIQYTYANTDKWAKHFNHFKKISAQKIWLNIPPAIVFVYQKTS